MFRFAQPEYLYLLLSLPLLGLLYVYVVRRRAKQIARFGDAALFRELTPEASWSKIRTKYLLITLSVVFLSLAAARPQFGAKLKETKKRGAEIVLVVDVSNSMLTEDFSPSRLERTKYAINRLIDKLSQDRIGLVVFAGDAFVQLPVTADFVSAKNFVSQISPEMISRQGTAIGKALSTAQRSFSLQSDKSRAIILISDGENHEDDAVAIADQIGKSGTVIHAIGIGTPEGAPINIGGEMMKDENGNIVVSKLNEEMLKQIAVSTGGSYVRATNQTLGLEQIIKQIRGMEEKEFSSMVFEEYDEQYQYVLALGLFLLLIEFLMLERKNRWIARMTLFHREQSNK